MSDTSTNRFERAPWVATDEDGETMWFAVTETSQSVAATLALMPDTPDAIDCVGGDGLDTDKVEPMGIQLTLPDVRDLAELPGHIRDQVKNGYARASWLFGVGDARVELDDDTAWKRRMAAIEEEYDRRQREDRGPMWWRARVRTSRALNSLSNAVFRIGRTIEPSDAHELYSRVAGERRAVVVRGNGRVDEIDRTYREEIRREVDARRLSGLAGADASEGVDDA